MSETPLATAPDDEAADPWAPADERLERGDQLREGLGPRRNPDADTDRETYPRENFYAEETDDDPQPRGHEPVSGTTPAEHKARELILRFASPLCKRDLELQHEYTELSDPAFPLPKQTELRPGVFVEYCQHRLRRRVNEERGYINFGESTGTALPEIDHDTYRVCCDLYLVEDPLLGVVSHG